MHIHAEPLPAGDGLRRAVLAALDGVVPDVRVIAPSLGLPGEPVLALDGDGRPLLVCFDGDDAGRALLDGLACLEAVTANGAFWAALCPGLAGVDMTRVGLLVLAPDRVPGATRLTVPGLALRRMRAVRVNGAPGLLLEPFDGEARPVQSVAGATTPSPFRSGLVALTADEEAFFGR